MKPVHFIAAWEAKTCSARGLHRALAHDPTLGGSLVTDLLNSSVSGDVQVLASDSPFARKLPSGEAFDLLNQRNTQSEFKGVTRAFAGGECF